jgi:hypothetical protein
VQPPKTYLGSSDHNDIFASRSMFQVLVGTVLIPSQPIALGCDSRHCPGQKLTRNLGRMIKQAPFRPGTTQASLKAGIQEIMPRSWVKAFCQFVANNTGSRHQMQFASGT